jgi:hypothetical protein
MARSASPSSSSSHISTPLNTAVTLAIQLPTISVTDGNLADSQILNTGPTLQGEIRPATSGRLHVPSKHSEVAAFVLGSSGAPSVFLAHEPNDATKFEGPAKDSGDENIVR